MNACARSLAVVACCLLASCWGTSGLLYEPKPEDNNELYAGKLPTAGVATRLDFGPGQETLLAEVVQLRDEKAQLLKDLDKQRAANAELAANLQKREGELDKETRQRKQAEAQQQTQDKRLRELEAVCIGLRIENKKLEQTVLLARIAELQRSLEDAGHNAVEAAAPPAGKL